MDDAGAAPSRDRPGLARVVGGGRPAFGAGPSTIPTLFGIDIGITDTKGVLGDTVETDGFSAQQISTRRIG